MKVHVNVYANLRQYSPAGVGSFTLNMASGSTIKNLIAALNIARNVKMVILVNGRRADAETHLSPEDKITLYQPIEGG
jgi:sulfur carrier protein ThiS